MTRWATHLGARFIITVSNAEKHNYPRRLAPTSCSLVPTLPNSASQFGHLPEVPYVAAVYDSVVLPPFDASMAVHGTLALSGVAKRTHYTCRSVTPQRRRLNLPHPADADPFHPNRREV
ncbi:hypothetical protein [Mycobacterium lepromatosis]|uniref:hypothetical protein n=1 Tax=Mycobacterium lepromatosis TaxID=480418 RepID=UPI001ED98B97|nr:hypothetical protein [Mycobacterium lepromatosis]